MVVGIGDRDGERRAEAHAVFRALDPNSIVSISVHGDPSRSKRSQRTRTLTLARNSALAHATAWVMCATYPGPAGDRSMLRIRHAAAAGATRSARACRR